MKTKLPEENKSSWPWVAFLYLTLKAQGKNKKMDFIKFRNCVKGHYQKCENVAYRMEENICKAYIWLVFKIQTTNCI